MNKRLVALGLVGTLGLAGAISVPIIISADDTTETDVSGFVQKLAGNLGLDQSVVQSAFDSTHAQIRSEVKAEVTTEIVNAVTAGTLTQRQADILTAVQNLEMNPPAEAGRPENAGQGNSTHEERQSQMEQMRAERHQSIVDQLNESGLNTTVDELEAAQEAAKSAEVRLMGGFGERGMGGSGKGHGPMNF